MHLIDNSRKAIPVQGRRVQGDQGSQVGTWRMRSFQPNVQWHHWKATFQPEPQCLNQQHHRTPTKIGVASWNLYLSCTGEGLGELRAGRPRDRNLAGAKFSRTRPDWPWRPPSLIYNGYQVSFPPIITGAEVKIRVGLHIYCPSGP
jgi:hypothetical protein